MKNNRILKSFVSIIIFFSINFGLWEIMVRNNISKEWASFLVYLILFIVMILIWKKELIREYKRLKEEKVSFKKMIFEMIIILLITSILGTGLLYLVTGNLATENTENVSEMVSTIPPILTCIMMSFFTPIIEELVFRESIVGLSKIKSSKIILIILSIISIIVFDSIHLYKWQEFFYYLPISIGLTFFYIRNNKNIWSSIFMHGLANLPGAILMILS